VSKNPGWPFVVRAGSVEIRAVGTAFNVRLQARTVEVMVTEGQVRVVSDRAPDTAAPSSRPPTETPLLQAGQQAIVALASSPSATAIQVSEINPAEMTRVLARQEPLLRLGGSTLAELAAEFERRTGRRVVLADPELASLRVGGRFRGDDLEGFIWLLEGNYGLKSERTAEGGLILRKAR
jgi:transmembrane sensor